MQYPIRFGACPTCGSQDRIIEMETNEEIARGNMPEGSKVPVLLTQARIFSPTEKQLLLPRLQIPIISCFFDVCVKCGTLYAVEVHKGTATMEPQIIKAPPPDMPPPQIGREN